MGPTSQAHFFSGFDRSYRPDAEDMRLLGCGQLSFVTDLENGYHYFVAGAHDAPPAAAGQMSRPALSVKCLAD
jgi:hypothetical protein